MTQERTAYFAVSAAPTTTTETSGWSIMPPIRRAAELLKRAAQGEFATVVVDSLVELLARDLENGVALLAQLNALGIGVRSIQEREITTEGPAGRGLAAFLEAVEKARKQRLKRNILAGQKRAERAGKPLGRPRRVVDSGEARRLADAGKTVREIADMLKIPKSTVQRVLASKMR